MRRLGVCVPLFLLALVALSFGVRRGPDPELWPSKGERIVIYVVDNGYHTNVVLPRERLAAAGGAPARALASTPPGPWVAVGWGDERFFTETGVNLRRGVDALRAGFAPNNPAATMFEPLRASPEELYRSGVVRLEVSPQGFARMAGRIDRSLALDAAGAPIPGPRGPVAQARFFRSTETFSVLKLCNHWTADVLSAAGVPVRPLLATWPTGLVFDLRREAARLDRTAPGG